VEIDPKALIEELAQLRAGVKQLGDKIFETNSGADFHLTHCEWVMGALDASVTKLSDVAPHPLLSSHPVGDFEEQFMRSTRDRLSSIEDRILSIRWEGSDSRGEREAWAAVAHDLAQAKEFLARMIFEEWF
jgi:hypothetical protein